MRRELSHRVRLLGVPQLLTEDVVQFAVQVIVLSDRGQSRSRLVAIIALCFTALTVVRHILGATISSLGL